MTDSISREKQEDNSNLVGINTGEDHRRLLELLDDARLMFNQYGSVVISSIDATIPDITVTIEDRIRGTLTEVQRQGKSLDAVHVCPPDRPDYALENNHPDGTPIFRFLREDSELEAERELVSYIYKTKREFFNDLKALEENGAGLVWQIARHVSKNMSDPMPSFSTAAALHVCAGLFARMWQLPRGDSGITYPIDPFLQIALIGPTGDGKTVSVDSAIELVKAGAMSAGRNVDGVFPDFIGLKSEGGLMQQLGETAGCAPYIDEFHKFGSKMKGSNAPAWITGIKDRLVLLHGTKNMAPDRLATPTPSRGYVQMPTMALLAMGVEEDFWKSLAADDYTNGYLNRFIIMAGDGEERRRIYKDEHKSPELVDVISKVIKFRYSQPAAAWAPGDPHGGWGNVRYSDEAFALTIEPSKPDWLLPCGASQEAIDRIRLFDTHITTLAKHCTPHGSPQFKLLTRFAQNLYRTALILAISDHVSSGDCAGVPEVRLKHVSEAEIICGLSAATFREQLKKELYKVTAPIEQAANDNYEKILRVVTGAGDKGVSFTDISKITGLRRSAPLNDQLNLMQQSGAIELFTVNKGEVKPDGKRAKRGFVAYRVAC